MVHVKLSLVFKNGAEILKWYSRTSVGSSQSVEITRPHYWLVEGVILTGYCVCTC